MAVVGATR